jgi:hypothetical protein
MANVLDNLAADIYKAADVVGRELVGFIPSATINANGSERAAKGDNVRASFTRAATAVNVTESMTIPEGTDQTVDSKTLVISKARAYKNASRAFGTAGTTPFGSNFSEVAELRQILVDNGMPSNDGQASMILGTLAGTNLRQLAQLQKANEAGGVDMLRQGVLLDLQGLMVKESAQVQSHTKGTGASYLVNDASHAIGDTTIAADGGSGTIIAGDVVTFNGDTNKYVVNTALAGGSFAIGSPGSRIALANDAAITVGNSYAANVAFHRTALEIAMRAPAVPDGGDTATDAMLIQDPFTGMVFEVRVYKGYRKTMIEVAASWGVKAWKPEHIAVLLG